MCWEAIQILIADYLCNFDSKTASFCFKAGHENTLITQSLTIPLQL